MRYFKSIQIIVLAATCALFMAAAYGDYNWPYGPPPDSQPPGRSKPSPGPQPNKPPKGGSCIQGGSIIGCETQTLGEVINVAGAPLSLHYQSDRVPGQRDTHVLKLRLSGATLPPNLQRIHLEIAIAGQAFKKSFAPMPNLFDTFTWDGKDGYGRPVQGQQPVKLRIGYEYIAQYYTTPDTQQASFNRFGSPPILVGSGGGSGGGSVAFSFLPVRTTTPPIILWQDYKATLGGLGSLGVGGWSPSIHHSYDILNHTLYLGDGTQRSDTTQGVGAVIATVAGSGLTFGQTGDIGDNKPALQAALTGPVEVAIGPDGSLYLADSTNVLGIRRVGPDGIITTVAGTTDISIVAFAIGPDGSLYFSQRYSPIIQRLGADGIITTVAGTGISGFSGDGGPATQAQLDQPNGVAVGPDGSLYIADISRIRRVGTDGIITTVAGHSQIGNISAGEGGQATQILLQPKGIAVGPDGSLYIADTLHYCIRRVRPDGTTTTAAGLCGTPGFAGDGGPATQARLNFPWRVALGSDGSLYIADTFNNRIRRVDPDGIITTVAGSGNTGNLNGGFAGDGGAAPQALLSDPMGVAAGPDGSLYIADLMNNRIRQLRSFMPGFSVGDIGIASEDGSQLYVFTGVGRHLKTLDALTGAVRFQFTYDSAGRLATITDGDGNVTSFERDSNGNPSAIIAPFGQRTTLAVNDDGYLSRVTNPAGEAIQLTYNTGNAKGLLATLTDPRGYVHRYFYDALGHLIRDENPGGGVKTLARNDMTDDHYAVTVTTAMGQVNTYEVEELPTGETRRVHIQPNGTRTESLFGTDGSHKTTFADGTVVNLLQGPDPRWSMQTPVSKSVSTSMGGLTSTLVTDRQALLADANNPMSLTRLTDTVTLNSRVYKNVFDKAAQTTTSTTPEGRISTTVTDARGRIKEAQVSGFLAANIAYDAKGRLSRVGQGAGGDERVVDFAYNPQGYLASVTDPLGHSFGLEYDAAGRITRQTQPDGRIIEYGYDANGNLASLTPPGRPAHVFHYASDNLTQEYVPPAVNASNNTIYDYDLDKHLAKITRPDAQILNFTYDSAGRRSILNTPDGAISYAYDPVTGKLTSITDTAGGNLGFTYSGGLLTQMAWTGLVSGSVGRTYDNNFRITSLNVSGAPAIAFQYDADGLLTQAGNLNLNRNPQNGVLTGTTLGIVTDNISYDGFGAIMDYTAKVGTTPAFSTQFTRDKLGRITRKIETVGGVIHTYEYGYDLAGRLEQVKQDSLVTASYTYDSNGNRLTGTGPNALNTAIYDDQDRLLSYAGSTYEYSANGELKTKTTGAATTRYVYDVLGALKHVTQQDGTIIDYVIDGRNRRIGKKVGGTLVQGFLYQDSLKPIAELDGTNAVVSRFVYATGLNVPDYIIKGGQVYRIITDHLGSPRLVVNVADGTVIQQLSYDEFGKVIQDTNPGFQPFGYAGGLFDRDTRLVRFGSRDYSAETGRWMAKDPIQFDGGDTNLYGYVNNNPVNLVDPMGLKTVDPNGPCCENEAASAKLAAYGLGAVCGVLILSRNPYSGAACIGAYLTLRNTIRVLEECLKECPDPSPQNPCESIQFGPFRRP